MSVHEQPHDSVPLREVMISQMGLFDYARSLTGDTNPLQLMPAFRSQVADPSETIAERWLSRRPGETLHEVFYLMGVEDATERQERIAQVLDVATDSGIGFGRGETMDDLESSGAPNVFKQLTPAFLRPTRTPEGRIFPYSHFGDPVERVKLLGVIQQSLSLSPRVIVNMGSEYDVTPSDAFPSSRVIHVDIDPNIVEFLRRSGFEAYRPDQVPEDLTADLIISIVCPAGQGNIPLSERGTLLTTDTENMPEGMMLTSLVPYDQDEILPLVTDPEALEHTLQSGLGLYLATFTKV